MKTKMIFLLMTLISVASYAQHDHHTKPESQGSDQGKAIFKDAALGQAYEYYARLKDALIASNATEAKKIADELQKSLSSFPNGKEASTAATTIAAADNLSDQREAFSGLSNEMTRLVKGQLSSGSIYREYCPMANGGSYWLSNEKEIKNPYFGNRMLRCGSVEEVLN